MSKRTEELQIRIFLEDKVQIKLKMEDAGILAMNAYDSVVVFHKIYLLCYR